MSGSELRTSRLRGALTGDELPGVAFDIGDHRQPSRAAVRYLTYNGLGAISWIQLLQADSAEKFVDLWDRAGILEASLQNAAAIAERANFFFTALFVGTVDETVAIVVNPVGAILDDVFGSARSGQHHEHGQ